MVEQPPNKTFKVGDLAQYSHPSTIFLRTFGRRIFYASSESTSLSDEWDRAVDAENKGLVGRFEHVFGLEAMPSEEGNGLVLCSCFEKRHGAGTWYHKILLGNHLYWIASEHLSKVFIPVQKDR